MPRLKLQQNLTQKLALKINPRSVALGRILEMNSTEFDQELQHELDENPALDLLSENSDREHDSHPEHQADDAFDETSEDLQRADYAHPDDIPSYRLEANNRDANAPAWDAAVLLADDNDSLLQLVMQRLSAEHNLSPRESVIAEHIAGNLDSNGWLTRPLGAIEDEIAMMEGFDPEPDELDRVFGYIRNLDPAGIGAVDLRDCLLLQLARRRQDAPVVLATSILTDYFDLFAKRHFEKIEDTLKISRTELIDAEEVIRSLNPRPAAGLGTGKAADRLRYINPDFQVDYDVNTDTFTITVLGRNPQLGIENSFVSAGPEAAKLNGRAAREALAFIQSKRRKAEEFIMLTNLRQQTLHAIISTIVRLQHDFFATGDVSLIRPMILKDISEATGLDISVISRATSGKYVLTAYGIYPLKLFFNERLNADSDVLAPQISEALAKLVENEDPKHPLTDRELTDALLARGFALARRTVSKYRERLNIPVARLRKKI